MGKFFQFLANLYEALRGEYHTDIEPPVAPKTPPVSVPVPEPKKVPMNPLYEAAKASLGKHMTLDESVDKSVGCGEAVSAVMQLAGVPGIPKKGIAGTAALLQFLRESTNFTEIPEYETGAVIISATGTGNGKVRGHVGICGINGIMSNESQTGLWKEHWDLTSWKAYYSKYGDIPLHFFRYKGL